jgi:D-lactate dehydrogenase
MKVTVFSAKPFEIRYLRKANQGRHDLHFVKEALTQDTLAHARGCQAIAIFSNDNASGPVLQGLKELGIRYVALRSAGYDHVDLEQARSLHLRVANVPAYSPFSIAEHAVAMMMALNRRLLLADRKVRDYDFRLDDLIGFDMHGKTVGIIGTGRTGRVVAKILHGFGCRLLGYDINPDLDLTRLYGLEYKGLEDLFPECDILTLHCPLNRHTRYLLGREQFSQMKPGVMIINTSRGGILHTADAIEALKSGQIGYLGLDVYEKEKGFYFNDHSRHVMKDDMFARLLAFKNVLVTGHQAFLTDTALTNIADTTLYNLDCWGQEEVTENELFVLR